MRLGVLIICLGALLVLSNGIIRGSAGLLDYLQLAKARDTMAHTVGALETENRSLEEEIGKIKVSKTYARKVLREKYHTTEENEHIVFFAE